MKIKINELNVALSIDEKEFARATADVIRKAFDDVSNENKRKLIDKEDECDTSEPNNKYDLLCYEDGTPIKGQTGPGRMHSPRVIVESNELIVDGILVEMDFSSLLIAKDQEGTRRSFMIKYASESIWNNFWFDATIKEFDIGYNYSTMHPGYPSYRLVLTDIEI